MSLAVQMANDLIYLHDAAVEIVWDNGTVAAVVKEIMETSFDDKIDELADEEEFLKHPKEVRAAFEKEVRGRLEEAVRLERIKKQKAKDRGDI